MFDFSRCDVLSTREVNTEILEHQRYILIL